MDLGGIDGSGRVEASRVVDGVGKDRAGGRSEGCAHGRTLIGGQGRRGNYSRRGYQQKRCAVPL